MKQVERAPTECAFEAGYKTTSKASCIRAKKSKDLSPLVVKYIGELREQRYKKSMELIIKDIYLNYLD